ncbi:DUF6207 family protein [Streptomyces sp. NPDC007904]|uniref:DUF6207 family protein n=1 Tax=Streptomyces sp. NPDC007904 TaxID=3364787 RepID=UPI0036E106EA
MRCRRWATATSDRTTRDPGQLSVRLRCLDARQELGTQPPRLRRRPVRSAGRSAGLFRRGRGRGGAGPAGEYAECFGGG